MTLIKGAELSATQQRAVLARFIYRHTIENATQTYGGRCPNCAQSTGADGRIITGGRPGPLPLKEWTRAEWHEYHTTHGAPLVSDAEWLAAHAFAIRQDGQLAKRPRHCVPAFMAGEGAHHE